MSDLKKLEKDAKKLATEFRKQASILAVKKAIAMADALAAATPVDTSKALSNWQVSAGFPKTRQLEAYVAGAAGSTQEASVKMTQQAARRSLANKKVGQEIYITNNTKYIEELNKGHSQQQPPGWIEYTAQFASSDFDRKNYKEFNPLVI